MVEYAGHPEADRVVVIMGSGGETVRETVDATSSRGGERVGVLQVRLYRPFPAAELLAALPPSVRQVAVLDRTKEPGSNGEPLYLDVVATLAEAHERGDRREHPAGHRRALRAVVEGAHPRHGGRHLRRAGAGRRPGARFTIGITDDVGGTSLPYDADLDIEDPADAAGGLLRPRLRRHGRREQEHRSRSSARTRTCTRRPTSSTTRRSPAGSPSRTCASARTRSPRPTW